MKLKILSSLVFLFSIVDSSGQVTFHKIFGGTGYDIFNNAALTSDSGYILVGLTDSMGAGNDDVYVVRTNAAGDTLWTAAYGGADIENGQSVIETFDGGFIIAGKSKHTSVSEYDIYLIKINANGDFLWSKSFGTAQNDYGHSVIETADSGYIITGRSEINQLNPDIFLIKVNSAGDTLWTKIYNGPDWDIAYSVIEDLDGGFVLTGYTENFGFGESDILLMKTDNNGNILWANAYGNFFHQYGWMVQHSNDSGFVIAGSSADSGGYNFTFIKTDATGTAEISKVYEGPGDDNQIRSLIQNLDGSYILGGTTFNYSTVNQDAYLICLDSLGDPLWAKTYGNTYTDEANALLPATGNGYVLCGRRQGMGFGFYDGYMIRTDSSGNSGCFDSASVVPNLLPGLSQIGTSFIEMPFAISVINPITNVRRGTSFQDLCLVDRIAESEKSDFNIYPNPSNEIFTIAFDRMIDEGTVEISNMLGEIILEIPVSHKLQMQIRLDNTERGIYFLSLIKDGNRDVKKIIVN